MRSFHSNDESATQKCSRKHSDFFYFYYFAVIVQRECFILHVNRRLLLFVLLLFCFVFSLNIFISQFHMTNDKQ